MALAGTPELRVYALQATPFSPVPYFQDVVIEVGVEECHLGTDLVIDERTGVAFRERGLP